MDDNGHQEEKKCPWGLECDKCRVSIEMGTIGTQRKFVMCSLPAMVTVLSEINIKTLPPQQKIQLPNILRG